MMRNLLIFTTCFLSSLAFGQTISNVSPNSGNRGSFQLPIVITGSGTNFSNATSTVVKISQATSTILDLEVLNVSSVTSTSVSCDVRIPNSAPMGSYTVSVYDQSIGGMVSLPNGFTVTSNPLPPGLVKTTPNRVALNQTLPITITVDNANFSQATDNTMFLSNNATNTLITPAPGSVVGLNGSHLRGTFTVSDPSLYAGSFLTSNCGNSFDGTFIDYMAILVTDPTYIYGNINYSGTFNGVVELYHQNIVGGPAVPITYSLVATAPVVSNTYSFNNVAEATYYIRAVPINMTDVVATYFDADISWQTAILASTSQGIPITCDITPVLSLSLPGGVVVNGTLGYGPNGYNKAQIVLAEGVEVFLKDNNNNLFAQTVTDQNGEFNFAGVGSGDYEIVIDIPGFAQVSTYSFNINSSSSNLNDLDFVIDDGEIFTSNFLSFETLKKNDLVLYPNPTSDKFTIKLPSDLTNANMTIYNTMGQIVQELGTVSSVSKSITTDVSALAEGVYIVRLQSDQFTSETRLVKTK